VSDERARLQDDVGIFVLEGQVITFAPKLSARASDFSR
jgi:hypothetical protein